MDLDPASAVLDRFGHSENNTYKLAVALEESVIHSQVPLNSRYLFGACFLFVKCYKHGTRKSLS